MTMMSCLSYDEVILSFSMLHGLNCYDGSNGVQCIRQTAAIHVILGSCNLRGLPNMEVFEMLVQQSDQIGLNVAEALRKVSIAAGVLGVLTILLATLAYIPGHPEFSPFNTFLSDIGDTPGWPQVLFNSGMLIVSPLRYLVLVLFAMRMWQLGAGRRFGFAVLVIGFIATLGTIAMTAVPFSTAPVVHKSGIGMYFLGVVFLQSIISVREWSLKALPRVLPLTSALLVAVFLVFFGMFLLYEFELIGRTMAATTEWLCALTSLAWVFTHGIVLGQDLA
jgi:hypothetical membrane protein